LIQFICHIILVPVSLRIQRGHATNTTKQDLITEVSKVTGLTQADTKIAVEELLQAVSDILCKGHTIEIRGFGTFYSKKRKPRPARNPKTGEVVPLKERCVPLFKFSGDLRHRVETGITVSDNAPMEVATPAQA
jgi:nucleoid DNA-binding protein